MRDRLDRMLSLWRQRGTRALVAHVKHKLLERAIQKSLEPAPMAVSGRTPAHAWIQSHFASNTPLRTYTSKAKGTARLNLVTDSIGQGSLFGGVGTALILGALMANQLKASLRIVTRTERAQPENLHHVLLVNGITLEQEVQFVFAPFFDDRYEIDITQDDLFLTTSWWTTQATLSSVSAQKVIYLLQEDERMFYPFGDERLRAEAVMGRSDIQFLINTQLLFDHLVLEGFDHLKNCGQWFEPAFASANSKVNLPITKASGSKRRFFFYARPNNPRNLFHLGLQVIEKAVCEGVLDPKLWELVLVGKDIPNLVFAGEVVPLRLENLNWQEYVSMVTSIDLGLSLMSTPHPSYPPLDLANAGAVVVTNRFGLKTDLSTYSANILCAEPELNDLVAVLQQGVELALNGNLRARNHAQNTFIPTWPQALSGLIERTLERIHVSN